MKKLKILIVSVSFLSMSMLASANLLEGDTSLYFKEKAPPSLADDLHLTKSKDPIDGGWLPDLTGLPNEAQVAALTQHVQEVMNLETDSHCKTINPDLRLLVFQHFAIYQQMANAQGIYFGEKTAYKWAHIMGMLLQESGGDSTNVTDMTGASVTTNKPETDLDEWNNMLSAAAQKHLKLNTQTNYGLLQLSSDRLLDAFHLAQNQSYDTEFLEGMEGAETPRKTDLNTAIAIRRLIWFYQDFAQGRATQTESRIHPEDVNDPAFSAQYQAGLRAALLYCGTRFLFHKQEQPFQVAEPYKLLDTMGSIAYCKLGNSQAGYGSNEFDEKCFAEWVTLCPALNIDIALLTPLDYFATRNAKPVCEDTFNRLINKPSFLDELENHNKATAD